MKRFSAKARPNRVEPTEEEQELEEMCAEAGWEKVGKWKKMVIFSNDDKDAAPLETDRYAKLESVRRSSKKTLMSEFAALILLAVLLAVILGIYLIDAPYYWELNVIYYGIMGLLVFTMGALEIGGYFKWLKRSRENIERGIDCWGTEKTGRKVQALSLAFFGISVIVVIVCVVILIWIN